MLGEGGVMGYLEVLAHHTVWQELSEWLVTNTTTASKYIGPESIEISPFRPQFIKSSKTVSYEVNFGLN